MQEVEDAGRWMLRFSEGETLPESLAEFASRRKVRSAAVPMGIGQFTKVRVGFWDGEKYRPKELTRPVEVVSLAGSIAEADGAPSIHLHATLGTEDHSTVSGHLLDATVGLLLESLVVPFPNARFVRPMDESVGLRRLDLGVPESGGPRGR